MLLCLQTCSLTAPAVPCEGIEPRHGQVAVTTAHPATVPSAPPNPFRRIGPPHFRPPTGTLPAIPAPQFVPTDRPALCPLTPAVGGM